METIENIAKRTCRGSRGVGVLIKACILEQFDVAVVENKSEGILWVQLIHRFSRSIGICILFTTHRVKG